MYHLVNQEENLLGKNTIVYRENLLNMGVLKYEEKIFSKTKNEQSISASEDGRDSEPTD